MRQQRYAAACALSQGSPTPAGKLILVQTAKEIASSGIDGDAFAQMLGNTEAHVRDRTFGHMTYISHQSLGNQILECRDYTSFTHSRQLRLLSCTAAEGYDSCRRSQTRGKCWLGAQAETASSHSEGIPMGEFIGSPLASKYCCHDPNAVVGNGLCDAPQQTSSETLCWQAASRARQHSLSWPAAQAAESL